MSNQRFIDGNREVIQRYIDAGGEGVELNEIQQRLLDRWRFADELIRQSFFGKYQLREDIANAIRSKFDVSRDTAYKDIVNAEHVFSSSAPLNKKYFIQRRIEWICHIISELTKPIERKNEKGDVIDTYIDEDKSAIAAKYEAILQKYVAIYPDYVPMRSPKTIIYNIQQNLLTTGITTEEAFTDADVIITQLTKDDGI
jgi:hypothetical protein